MEHAQKGKGKSWEHPVRPSGKVQSLSRLAAILESLRAEGKRVVLCHGVFDLLHPGHIRHLQSARKQGDVLVVSLTADAYVRKGPGRPIFNQALRAETLAALEMVDYVCLVDDYNALSCIRKLRPHVYAKGPEHSDPAQDPSGDMAAEEKAVKAVGGEMFFTSGEPVFSSTRLLNLHAGILSEQQRSFLESIKERYTSDTQVIGAIKGLENLKVLVVGDTIIDEYVYCEPLGQSLKNNLVVHQFLKEERFCGGVIAVANQIAEFCKEVHVVTAMGAGDPFEPYVRSHLRNDVGAQVFLRHDAPTVVKRRYVYANVEQKVFEICHIQDHNLPSDLEAQAASYLRDVCGEHDMVMVCDYGHGTLTPRIVGDIRAKARFLAVNAQTNSANMGYNLITKKYSGLDFALVDEAEARLALQEKHGQMEELGPQLLQRLDARQLVITRGRNGSLAFDRNGDMCTCPAFAMQVVDRVGAGDAFFAVTAPCLAMGMSLDLASFIGNTVGALAIQIVGNRETVAPKDLFRLISTLLA